jgi:transcriptional regulator with XRE-family HTH domain
MLIAFPFRMQKLNKQLKDLGKRLRNLRAERGVSIDTVASKAGISKSSVSDTENGKNDPRYSTLLAWARSLGVSLAKIVDRK